MSYSVLFCKAEKPFCLSAGGASQPRSAIWRSVPDSLPSRFLRGQEGPRTAEASLWPETHLHYWTVHYQWQKQYSHMEWYSPQNLNTGRTNSVRTFLWQHWILLMTIFLFFTFSLFVYLMDVHTGRDSLVGSLVNIPSTGCRGHPLMYLPALYSLALIVNNLLQSWALGCRYFARSHLKSSISDNI